MKYEELQQLDNVAAAQPPLICGRDLKDQTARTLIYGYDTKRNTFHVYLDTSGFIRAVLYDSRQNVLDQWSEKSGTFLIGDPLSNEVWVPNKRAYPECCDYEFCRLLIERGISIPFTTYDTKRVLDRYVWGYAPKF